ncbi:MAG: zinc ribbon domain-containing protein [Desulfotomaculales bacterium]
MKRRQRPKKKAKVQKVKKTKLTGNELFRSVHITVPKKLVNKAKLDAVYELDQLHARAVNEWIGRWYNRTELIEKILRGTATTLMQKEALERPLETPLPSAYVQIAGNRMLDILREHYLAVQDKIASDVWKDRNLSVEYRLVCAVFVRNAALFHRFVNGLADAEDVVAKWRASQSEQLRKVAEAYDSLSPQARAGIAGFIVAKFWEIRAAWRVPAFKGGVIQLDYRVFTLEEARGTKEFNLWAWVTTAVPHRRIAIPLRLIADKRWLLDSLFPDWLKSTARKAQLVIRGRHIRLSVPVAKQRMGPKGEPEAVLGCDIGMSALLNLSNGLKLGKSYKEIAGKLYDEYLRLQSVRNKIRSLRQRAEKRLSITKNPETRHRLERKIAEYDRHLSDHRWVELRRRIKAAVSTEIGRVVNQFLALLGPSPERVLVVMENLTEMTAEGARRSSRARFDLSVWARGELQDHLKRDLEWLGGRVAFVPPEYTSQICPICGWVDKGNRRGREFRCQRCGFVADADVVGAINIGERFSDAELLALAEKYWYNKYLRREKIKELLLVRAANAA